jgi:hypothetical protein
MRGVSDSLAASRRSALLLGLALLSQFACSQPKTVPDASRSSISNEDAGLKVKFRGVYGGELRVDSTFATNRVLILNPDTGYLFNIGRGSFGPKAASYSSYGGGVSGDRLVIPIRLRMLRYPEEAKFLNAQKFPYYDGAPIVDVTVPVAERIPDEALDDLRKNGGSLRLKLRIHPETLLVGWDIVRRPRSAPRDPSGLYVYVAPQFSSLGGDFREAIIDNGRVVERGWYIDPQTGERIETNY